MTEPNNNTWTEVSDRLDALTAKLRAHLDPPGANELPGALHNLRQAVKDAFDAAGAAVHDDAVRADVREVGQLLGDALAHAFTKFGADVKQFVDGRSEKDTPPPGNP
jgi:Flp pilus assembly pilin Flp